MKIPPKIIFHRSFAILGMTVENDIEGTVSVEACNEGLRITFICPMTGLAGVETNSIILPHQVLATELLPAVADLDRIEKNRQPPASQNWRNQ